jgi:hypothetical protein
MGYLEQGQELTVADLKETHELYDDNKEEWRFLMAAYEGTRALVDLGYLEQNERETDSNWERRKKEAGGFNYTRSIVDLFNYYLFKKPVIRVLGKLKDYIQWSAFEQDCNLYGDGFDQFLTEQGRYASIEGYVGIMVDKPNVPYETIEDEILNGVYPYLAAYFPTAILDWEYERDENNRPYLSFLKLKDDDGKYRLWWPSFFEIWEEPVEELETPTTRGTAVSQKTKAIKINEGTYNLNAIPFVWLINVKGKKRPIGMSDVHEVARLDVSILRNISQGEEVINYAAFPMMRKPYKENKPDGGISAPAEDQVSPTAILEFDPENPDSKPDWLRGESKESIDAILLWIENKISEIYRTVNAGGMASTEISTTAKSGTALKTEFQLLNSALVRKAINLEKAEMDIIRYWLAWQNIEEYFAEITVERERSYDVEDLASDLENALTASLIVKSPTFNARLQKNIARQMLPGIEDEDIEVIDDEIDYSVYNAPEEEFIEGETDQNAMNTNNDEEEVVE